METTSRLKEPYYVSGFGYIIETKNKKTLNSQQEYFETIELAKEAIIKYNNNDPLVTSKVILSYSDNDIGKIFAKKAWNTNSSGTSGTMFTWNPAAKLYGYCHPVGPDKAIYFKTPSSKRNQIAGKICSEVGQAVLDAELVEIDYRKIKERKTFTTQTTKGNKMKLTKEDILDALCENKEVEVEEKTDLEARTQYKIDVYNSEETFMGSSNIKSKKEAKKFLQNPNNIGKTVVLSKEVETLTTDIPVISKKRK